MKNEALVVGKCDKMSKIIMDISQYHWFFSPKYPLLGKEVHATTRQFTIIISGSNVEKHDVSLYSKFQGNRINILEITAVFIYDEKNEKPTVFFSILSPNLPPIQISIFEKKVFSRVLDLGKLSHFLSIAPHF